MYFFSVVVRIVAVATQRAHGSFGWALVGKFVSVNFVVVAFAGRLPHKFGYEDLS